MWTSVKIAAGLGAASSIVAWSAVASVPVTSYQSNDRHTGVASTTLELPLELRWSRPASDSTFALAAAGRLFVAGQPTPGTVTAMALGSGRVLWRRDVGAASIGYGQGRVYAVTDNCTVLALDAETGRSAWARRLWQGYLCPAPPLVAAGHLYVQKAGSANRLYAFRARDGRRLWSRPIGTAGRLPPAATQRAVYVTGLIDAWAFRHDGSRIWHASCCDQPGGVTPSLYRGRVYGLGNGGVLAMGNGDLVGSLDTESPLAFADGVAFRIWQGRLEAVRLSDASVPWTFASTAPIQAPPLVVGAHVFVADIDGRVTAVRRSDGEPVWHRTIDMHVYSSDLSQWYAGLAASAHRLVVPAVGRLFAFSPGEQLPRSTG